MTIPTRAGIIATAAIALGIGLSGCGSDTTTDGSETTTSATTSETTTSAAPTTSAEAAAPKKTIVDYIRENNITETISVTAGAPGAPTIEMPIPQGWEDAGSRTPEWAYSAILYSDPSMTDDPPTIIALLSKLTGDVDPAKILEYAPGEIQNLPGYEGPDSGKPSTLGGFDAVQIGGTYTRDGVRRMIAQKTVVIPSEDGLYVLQLNADGTEDQDMPLIDATETIDDQTTITF